MSRVFILPPSAPGSLFVQMSFNPTPHLAAFSLLLPLHPDTFFFSKEWRKQVHEIPGANSAPQNSGTQYVTTTVEGRRQAEREGGEGECAKKRWGGW